MNWTVVAVISVVTLLVSAGMFATFRSAKDTYTYQEHYTRNGFSQELPGDLLGDELSKDNVRAEPSVEQKPVSEWPTEL